MTALLAAAEFIGMLTETLQVYVDHRLVYDQALAEFSRPTGLVQLVADGADAVLKQLNVCGDDAPPLCERAPDRL